MASTQSILLLGCQTYLQKPVYLLSIPVSPAEPAGCSCDSCINTKIANLAATAESLFRSVSQGEPSCIFTPQEAYDGLAVVGGSAGEKSQGIFACVLSIYLEHEQHKHGKPQCRFLIKGISR